MRTTPRPLLATNRPSPDGRRPGDPARRLASGFLRHSGARRPVRRSQPLRFQRHAMPRTRPHRLEGLHRLLRCLGHRWHLGPHRRRRLHGRAAKALDLGVNFFDTADVYGDGHGERLLARLKDGPATTSTSPSRRAGASTAHRRGLPRPAQLCREQACRTCRPTPSTCCNCTARPPRPSTCPRCLTDSTVW